MAGFNTGHWLASKDQGLLAGEVLLNPWAPLMCPWAKHQTHDLLPGASNWAAFLPETTPYIQ